MSEPVDQAAEIRAKLLQDNDVSQFAQEGAELLEKTNKPNVITFDQFLPYRELFAINKDRYGKGKDAAYTKNLDNLFYNFRHVLGINLHEVTYVVASEQDQTVVIFLDRVFTRISAATNDHMKHRSELPANLGKMGALAMDGAILKAQIQDLVEANFTEPMKEFFLQVKRESAVIQRNFTDNNLSPDKRPSAKAEGNNDTSTDDPEFTLADDDD